MKAIVLFLQL